MFGGSHEMRRWRWTLPILILFVLVPSKALPDPAKPRAPDYALYRQEAIFLESMTVSQPLLGGISLSGRLRSPSWDLMDWGQTLTLKPSLELIDKSSYSLKLSLPLTLEPLFMGFLEEGSPGLFPPTGLMASLRLKSFPTRYGSWTLNTGLFFLLRDQNNPESPPLFGNPEGGFMGIGTVNISISY